MNNWVQFAQTRHGSQLNHFFHKLNDEIAEVTQLPDKLDGVLLLNTKKGYWLYKIFDREETVQPIKVYSDRYAQKLTDYSDLKNKLIYLVDDTLLHGNGLFDTYKLLSENITDEQCICPIVFALHEDIDPKEKAAHADDELHKKFWSSLKYFIRMADQEVGEFCISVTDLLHSCGIPYVIDLPYLRKGADSKTNYEVVLTNEQFLALQEETALWKFQENSFDVREVNFLPGFSIHMKDEPLLSAFRDCFIDFTIAGTYTEDEDGNKHVVFIPFAIAKSISTERLKLLWNLFADITDTPPDYELPTDQTKKETAEHLWHRSFRECIYLLSMIIAERFKEHLKSLADISLQYDYDILEEHFPGNFVKRAQTIEKKLQAEPNLIYQQLLILSDSAPADTKANDIAKMNCSLKNVQKKEAYQKETAYTIILNELQKQKTDVLKGKKLILLEADTIRRLLSERFSFTDPTEERYELSNLIATFLLSSIFGSRLQISSDGKTIIKGFRYGENSDHALPFLNLVFYWAVVLMVDQIGRKNLRNCYDDFSNRLKEQFEKLHLLSSPAEKDNFEDNNNYFKNIIQNNLHIYNKSFYLNPFYYGELPESDNTIMYKIEDFVTNTTY